MQKQEVKRNMEEQASLVWEYNFKIKNKNKNKKNKNKIITLK